MEGRNAAGREAPLGGGVEGAFCSKRRTWWCRDRLSARGAAEGQAEAYSEGAAAKAALRQRAETVGQACSAPVVVVVAPLVGFGSRAQALALLVAP